MRYSVLRSLKVRGGRPDERVNKTCSYIYKGLSRSADFRKCLPIKSNLLRCAQATVGRLGRLTMRAVAVTGVVILSFTCIGSYFICSKLIIYQRIVRQLLESSARMKEKLDWLIAQLQTKAWLSSATTEGGTRFVVIIGTNSRSA